MQVPQDAARLVRFGVFEVDLEAGELRKQGVKVKLQEQPLQVLAVLLEKPGHVVTREDLQKRLWSDDTFVDFETGLNTAIKKIREALGDSADNPRFVETLHRRGYRFIAPVEALTPRPSPPGRGWFRKAGPGEGAPLRIRRWAPTLVAVAFALVLGIWILQRTKETPVAELVSIPLTSYPGYELYPSFSPDGTQVAFEWCPEGPSPNCDIYIKEIGVEPPSRLTTDPAEDLSPAWSPDGRFIAFLRKLSSTRVALILIPQRGGQEQVLGATDLNDWQGYSGPPGGSNLSWTPDSKWLAVPWGEAGKPAAGIFLLNVARRETRRLTNSDNDEAPTFSPDGRTLAFNGPAGSRNFIYLMHLTRDYQPEGELERLAPANDLCISNGGAAWTADGRDLVFSSYSFACDPGLWRVAASAAARPRRIAFASDGASQPTVSRQGNRLAYVVIKYDDNIWRIDLPSPGHKPGTPTKLIASTRDEQDPAYSPDGKRIAFMSTRSGTPEIWVCASDGSNPVQLTALGVANLFAPRWSPDGQTIVFTAAPQGNYDLYVVSANGGPPRRLTNHPEIDKWPSWSQDGKFLYFTSTRASPGGDIWKMPAGGGDAIRITRHGGDGPQASPDGRFVYYEKGWPSQSSVWRVPVEGGEEVKVLEPTHPYARWTVRRQGIYYFTPPDRKGRSYLCLYKLATGQTTRILSIERPLWYSIALSPDERAILYGQFDQTGSDLMLVENFR